MTLTLPSPQLPDPATVPSLKWGIVGTGIARAFVKALAQVTRQKVVAVTARDADKTRAFAAELGIERVHPSVSALIEDPDVEVVYIATPHPLHREQALAAVAAGKHVLIEKPMAMSAAEAREITAAGVAAGVLVMEAMWTRYLPQADVIRRVIADGTIGEVHRVTADFGFVSAYDPSSRMWAPELGGGALLDAGIYPISFASSILGPPTRIEVAGVSGPGGVDAASDILLVTPTGRALVSTSLNTPLPTLATVNGTEGMISIAAPFFGPSAVTVARGTASWDGERAEYRNDRLAQSNAGIGLQATAFASYVADGRLESPLHPHEEVIDVLNTIDVVRASVRSAH
jgi:predicted dehydrogenase